MRRNEGVTCCLNAPAGAARERARAPARNVCAVGACARVRCVEEVATVRARVRACVVRACVRAGGRAGGRAFVRACIRAADGAAHRVPPDRTAWYLDIVVARQENVHRLPDL